MHVRPDRVSQDGASACTRAGPDSNGAAKHAFFLKKFTVRSKRCLEDTSAWMRVGIRVIRECDVMETVSETNGGRASRMNRVRELRENRLMTQAQLARKAKVALRTIHSVEKGMNCRMDTKRKILLALGLRFEDKDQVFPPLERQDRPTFVPQY